MHYIIRALLTRLFANKTYNQLVANNRITAVLQSVQSSTQSIKQSVSKTIIFSREIVQSTMNKTRVRAIAFVKTNKNQNQTNKQTNKQTKQKQQKTKNEKN